MLRITKYILFCSNYQKWLGKFIFSYFLFIELTCLHSEYKYADASLGKGSGFGLGTRSGIGFPDSLLSVSLVAPEKKHLLFTRETVFKGKQKERIK